MRGDEEKREGGRAGGRERRDKGGVRIPRGEVVQLASTEDACERPYGRTSCI